MKDTRKIITYLFAISGSMFLAAGLVAALSNKDFGGQALAGVVLLVFGLFSTIE